MRLTLMEKDGITQEVISPTDVARLKTAGYKIVKESISSPEDEQAPDAITPEEENEEAIKKANAPAGSKKAGKK